MATLVASSASAEPASERKQPTTAVALSLGGIAVNVLAITGGIALDERLEGPGEQRFPVFTTAGVVVGVLAPSAGHWYAGRVITPGLVLRAGGAGVVSVAAIKLFETCWGDDDDGCSDAYGYLVWAGIGVYVAGTAYDLFAAPGAVRRWNRAHGLDGELTIAPTVVRAIDGAQPGLGVSGRF